MLVKVGILTLGTPILKNRRVVNALMGKDFHWQRTYTLLLPNEAEIINADNGILTVSMPLEQYLQSVAGSEMSPMAPLEFLKTHAIISRSWVVGKILKCHSDDNLGKKDNADEIRTRADTASHTTFHVCNDDHCQRYQGVQPLNAAAVEAVASTAGIILTDAEGKPADARFSKCCGGKTELFATCWQDRNLPYLQAVEDEWCNPAILTEAERIAVARSVMKEYDTETTPDYYRWEESVSASDIALHLRTRFKRNIGHITDITALERGKSGRIHRLLIQGTEGKVILGKELAVRRLLSSTHLLSSAFSIERHPAPTLHFRLLGKGWGHGVGLCQTGAAVMAMRGFSAQQILAHYYPGTKLSQLKSDKA